MSTSIQLSTSSQIFDVHMALQQAGQDLNNGRGRIDDIQQVINRSRYAIASLKANTQESSTLGTQVTALENRCEALTALLNQKLNPVQNALSLSTALTVRSGGSLNSNGNAPYQRNVSAFRGGIIPDLFYNAMTFLPFSDMGRCARTCKEARAAAPRVMLNAAINRTELTGAQYNALRKAPNILKFQQKAFELSQCTNLQRLNYPDLTTYSLDTLIPQLPLSLRQLAVGQDVINTNYALKRLLTQCPLLESIFLNDFPNGETMNILADHKGLKHISLIRFHSVRGYGGFERDRDALHRCLTSNTQLESLNLKDCWCANNDTMGVVANLKNVRNLKLESCDSITNDGLITLLKGNQQLQTIDLEGNSWVNNRTLVFFANHPGLRHIKLRRCPNITISGLQNYIEGSNQLKTLRIICDQQLYDNGLVEILEKIGSKSGKRFQVRHYKSSKDAEQETALTQYPQLTVLDFGQDQVKTSGRHHLPRG